MTRFDQRLSGDIQADERLAREDFIIHRRDGLFAYNLAVAVDDHFQGVTEIVRGADLIEPAVRQITVSAIWLGCPEIYSFAAGASIAQGNKAVEAKPRACFARWRSTARFDRRAAISQPEYNKRMAGPEY